MTDVLLSEDRLRRAKSAYTTRRVPRTVMRTVIVDGRPHAGDVVLARVVEIGHHASLEHPSGRRATLFPGDEILVCYGNRYAPDQFEAVVPHDPEPCHLVAQGGVAAQALSWHSAMKAPTRIEPIGLVGRANGAPLNLRDFGLPPVRATGSRPRTIASIGTAMNAGKTTTAANLIRGLVAAGLRVGAAKVTGTGAGKDLHLMADAGAFMTLDFVDAGYPSTYLTGVAEIEQIVRCLTGHLAAAGADVVVLEVADGLFQRETAALCGARFFSSVVDDVLFSAGDAMGVVAGVTWLRERGLPVRAVSGLLTASPLAIREAATATRLPVWTIDQLRDPRIAQFVAAVAPAA